MAASRRGVGFFDTHSYWDVTASAFLMSASRGMMTKPLHLSERLTIKLASARMSFKASMSSFEWFFLAVVWWCLTRYLMGGGGGGKGPPGGFSSITQIRLGIEL